jgi:hypothetical protein
MKRVITEQKKRPLLKDLSSEELLVFIENRLKDRASFYNQAKIILPVTAITTHTINTIQ